MRLVSTHKAVARGTPIRAALQPHNVTFLVAHCFTVSLTMVASVITYPGRLRLCPAVQLRLSLSQ